MNLLSLIIIALALIVVACVFYVAWELSSDKPAEDMQTAEQKKEPDESKES
jgi:flagellar basal body-associated protein FliL